MPPVITVPSNIMVEATGYLIVVNLGDVTAFDTVSGSITPTVDPAGPYASSIHSLIWTATNAAGITLQDIEVYATQVGGRWWWLCGRYSG